MIRVNEHFLKLQSSYLFSDIAQRVAAWQRAHPDRPLIRLGIGDVTEPLPEACRLALHAAIDEMGTREAFRGYGPEQGYAFLREAIAEHDFRSRGCDIAPDEVYVSDGSKCDVANIQELFAADIRVAVPDPVYPVYVDTNVMAGRTGAFAAGRYEGLVYLRGTAENGYCPAPPSEPVDLIYLCFPNNPTGAVASRAALEAWVAYARECRAVILFDAAYAAFVRDPAVPRSIYEIPGARGCAIEFRSFSKTAGFTGLRCAYTVVPWDLMAMTTTGETVGLQKLWQRRYTTKFNGVAYPVQRAAAAIYTPAGKRQVEALIEHYMENARLLREGLLAMGYAVTGGDNAPYLWASVGESSWAFFDRLLDTCGVVCTPGAGFGLAGEGHVRLSAFNSRQAVVEALDRMRAHLAR